MRATEPRPDLYEPRPAYSTRKTLVGTALVAAAFLVAALTVAHPATTAVTLLAVAAGATTRRLARRPRTGRRNNGQSRRVCLPTTDVCVEA